MPPPLITRQGHGGMWRAAVALMVLIGLQAAMQKAGLSADCSASEDACTAAANMRPEDVARLPLPGEVEFIMGGPPCQGYSGMNR
jgi:site-specific DNA-cytosine methylase